MTDIEWKGKPLKNNIVHVDFKSESHIIADNDATAPRIRKHVSDEHDDGNTVFKVIDPSVIKENRDINITDHKLTEKGGSNMSDKLDSRYNDLKEDFRE